MIILSLATVTIKFLRKSRSALSEWLKLNSTFRRGTLLVDCPEDPALVAHILSFLSVQEKIEMKSVLARSEILELFEAHLRKNQNFIVDKCTKEILFTLPLPNSKFFNPHKAQRLEQKHFSAWDDAMTDFLTGEGLPLQGNIEQRKIDFFDRMKERRAWGVFEGERLVSTAGLSAAVEGASMVGAVFTRESHRKRGLSQATMVKLIEDASTSLGLTKLVLFTGLHNQAAQAMYRKLGFVEIGNFGMLFGHAKEH